MERAAAYFDVAKSGLKEHKKKPDGYVAQKAVDQYCPWGFNRISEHLCHYECLQQDGDLHVR
jgi:hypothetical protein